MSTRERRSIERGQSEVLGFILVFALIVVSTGIVVTLGGGSITDAQNNIDADRAETSLAQLDSQAALVALGSSDVQQVELPSIDGTGYQVEEDAGWMNISFKNTTSGKITTIHNATLGAVVYDGAGQTKVAYQGGGVWRKGVGEGSVMIAPPEFHYRSATLTLPLVTVRGSDTIDSRATITQTNTTRLFPNSTLDSDFKNPLESGKVNVTVQSEYYQAWGRYFKQRTDGDVTYDHTRSIAKIELTVPFEEDFSNVVATTEEDGITYKAKGKGKKHNSEVPEPYTEGINYPDVDERINETIQDCKNNAGACTNKSASSQIDITSAGTYYIDSDYSDKITVDDPGGNVTVAVDGAYESNGIEISDVDRDHSINILVRGDFKAGKNNNKDGVARELRVLLHSDGSASFDGNYHFTGLLYAPGSHCDLNGGGANTNINGGIICETVKVNGMPNEFTYDPSIEGINFDLNPPNQIPITYLHISDNEIEVDS
ncbi:MAG: hypothetical protein V5A34_08945 [Halapricum sp.]